MPTYIALLSFTQQGVESIKDAQSRLAGARQVIESMGARMDTVYYTMGQYDAVAILEAPDDETVSKLALAIASRGNVRTETLRAFTPDEFYDNVVAGLP